MVLILRPFTAGEDAVIAWATLQDDSEMVGLIHMTGGRDYIVLQRLYASQSYREALREQETFALGRIGLANSNMPQADTRGNNNAGSVMPAR